MEPGGSQLPLTPVPSDAAPSSGFCEHYTHTHTRTCAQTQNTQFRDINHLKGARKIGGVPFYKFKTYWQSYNNQSDASERTDRTKSSPHKDGHLMSKKDANTTEWENVSKEILKKKKDIQ